jgi:hypothetical protein
MRKSIFKTALISIFIIFALARVAMAGQDVKFAWDLYTDPVDTVDGFKLYMAAAPGVAVTPANLVATIPGQASIGYAQKSVPAGLKYWILTAYKTAGNLESGPSNEVSYTVKLKPPSGLGSTVVVSFGNVTVTVAAK